MFSSTTNYSAVGVVIVVEPLVEDSYLPSFLSSILLSPSCSPSSGFPVLGNRAYQNSGDPLIINPICSSSCSCSYAYTLERGSRFECP